MTEVQGPGVSANTPLPFSERKQDAMLGHLLTDQRFFLQARSQIRPEWFSNVYAQKVYRSKLAWYDKYQRIPTVQEMEEAPELVHEENKIRQACLSRMRLAVNETQNFGLDALSEELNAWLKTRIFLEGMDKCQERWAHQKYEEAFQVVDASMKRIKEASFDRDYEMRFDDYKQHFANQELERENACTFGLDLVDHLLLPGNVTGGLLRGDTTILLAPTNVGKSRALITTMVANLKLGKRILYLTHEGRPDDLYNLIWCAILDQNFSEVMGNLRDPTGLKIMDRAQMILDRYLTYIPYNKAGATVEEVEAIIRKRQEQLIAREGVGYDMLVCDYPAKLTTLQARGGHFNQRDIQLIVYGYFVQLALEYGFHSLLAIQTNREGAKVNKGNHEIKRLLTMEDVSEAYGPMQLATNVLTINRDPLAKARNRLTYYIDKSRSNETGWAVVCRTNYAHAITHSNILGATYYRGTSTMADKLDTLLEKYPGREVPFEEVSAS